MKKINLAEAINEKLIKGIDFNSISLSNKDCPDSEILIYDECQVNNFE